MGDMSHATPAHPRQELIEARKAEGWSQQDVAERIGTTYVNISRWERGLTKPTPYFRRKLCQLFGKSEHELGLGPPSKKSAPTSAPSHPPLISPLYDSAIPLQATRLVGRDAMLTQLKRRLCASGIPSIALTALNGLPGVGKTALSIALAHDSEVREYFRDGILWAGMGPHPNLPALLGRWGTLLGISSNELGALKNEDLAMAVHHAIGSRSMLLVLDDAWTTENALLLKVGGPHCAHLVTTRFPAIALDIASDGATILPELSEDEGMTLLKMLAPSVVEHERKRAADLVHAVGGLPLALTLMGKYLNVQAYSKQSRRIRAALEHLNDAENRLQITEPRGPVDRHSSLPQDSTLSLKSVIAVTDQQLKEQERAAWYTLAVFPAKPNNFSEEAALAVMDAPLAVLDALIDAGLLESNIEGRYTLHQTIADYASICLHELPPSAQQAAYERFVSYAISYCEAHKKDYEQLEQETNILLAALEAAYEQNMPQALIRSVCAFAPYLLLRGFYPLAQEHLQRAHEAAQTLHDEDGITSTLLYLGEIAQKQGNYAQAAANFQQGLEIARRLNNSERISTLLNDLGWVTWKQGNYTQAETYLQEGLTLARQIQDPERICSILKTLGSVVGSQGDYIQAEIYQQEGLEFARRMGDREQICVLLISLGVTTGEQGDHAQAEEYFKEGLVLARQIGHKEWISALLSNLGAAASEQGHYTQAEEYFQEGLIFARQIEHREWTSSLLNELGVTMRKQRNYSEAEKYLQESLSLARLIGPQMIADALYEYGNLYLDQQQVQAAESTFHEMLTIIPEGSQDLLALAQYGLARTAAAQGKMSDARKFGETSVIVLETLGHHKANEVRYWLGSTTGRV